MIKTVKQALTCTVKKSGEKWVVLLSDVVSAYWIQV